MNKFKFKHAALALATAGLLSAQAHAGEAQVESLQALPVAAFSQTDINAMFEQMGQPMQLAALSGQEMMETEGALAPWAAGALAGGAWQGATFAMGAARGQHAWNTRRFIGNVGTGALIGAGAGQMRFIASGGVRGFRNLAALGGAIWAGNASMANIVPNHLWRR